jgi:hypothetical protein
MFQVDHDRVLDHCEGKTKAMASALRKEGNVVAGNVLQLEALVLASRQVFFQDCSELIQ